MMATHAARTPVALVAVDPALPAAAQAQPLHNRWHPDIPPVATTATDVAVRLESVDWTGGQIGNNDCADDVRDVDLTRCHHLTGPIRVCDKETSAPAAPGDLLVVEILDIAPLKGYEWGVRGPNQAPSFFIAACEIAPFVDMLTGLSRFCPQPCVT